MIPLWAVIVSTFLAQAAPADISRPAPRDRPTRVRVMVAVLDVEGIDAVDQSFICNVYYEARWSDPRLAHSGTGEIAHGLDQVWHPRLTFLNKQRFVRSLPRIAEVAPDGEVVYRQRVWAPFSQPLDVDNFPFDRQRFELPLLAAGFTPEEVELVPDPERVSGIAPELSVADWDITGFRAESGVYRVTPDAEAAATFKVVFEADRRSAYYVLKVILPLVLIVAMSWTVFWLNPEQAGTQIGVATTSMLTLIAYRFMVGGFVPRVPYLTRMDVFILGSTLLVFVAVLAAVLTAYLAAGGRADRARTIERSFRWLFPATSLAAWTFAFTS